MVAAQLQRKTRIPAAIREQYSAMLAKPEAEMVHPDLYRKILDDGTDAILQSIKKYNDERKKLIQHLQK